MLILWCLQLFYSFWLMFFQLCRIVSRRSHIHISKKFKLSNVTVRVSIVLVILVATIYDTTLTFKQEITEKLSTLNIPSYVTDRYTFSLKYYFYKCPPLLICELGLAFLLPFPDSLFCGFFSTLNHTLIKPCHRVVSDKYHTDNYKGHIHINIEIFWVLLPILPGDVQDS